MEISTARTTSSQTPIDSGILLEEALIAYDDMYTSNRQRQAIDWFAANGGVLWDRASQGASQGTSEGESDGAYQGTSRRDALRSLAPFYLLKSNADVQALLNALTETLDPTDESRESGLAYISAASLCARVNARQDGRNFANLASHIAETLQDPQLRIASQLSIAGYTSDLGDQATRYQEVYRQATNSDYDFVFYEIETGIRLGLLEFDKHYSADPRSIISHAKTSYAYHKAAYDRAGEENNNFPIQRGYAALWCAEMKRHLGEPQEAETYYAEATRINNDIDNKRGIAFTGYSRAVFTEILELAQKAVADFQNLGSNFHTAIAYELAGSIFIKQGMPPEAKESFQNALHFHGLVSTSSSYTPINLRKIAFLTKDSDLKESAKIFGAAQGAEDTMMKKGISIFQGSKDDEREMNYTKVFLKLHLGEDKFNEIYQAGVNSWKEVLTRLSQKIE